MKNKMIRVCVLSALLVATLGVNSFAAANVFTDLEGIAAKDKIIELYNNGYIKGISDDRFAPNEALTAAQGVQLMVNALELNLDNVRFIKEPKATDYFTKADDSAWYANALIIASVKGLELPKDLDPNQPWTREEFTYQLIKAVEKQRDFPMINILLTKITDEDQLEISYSGAIQRAIVYGVIKLDSEGKFKPKEVITRADAAQQIYNVLEYLKAHPFPKIDSGAGETK